MMQVFFPVVKNIFIERDGWRSRMHLRWRRCGSTWLKTDRRMERRGEVSVTLFYSWCPIAFNRSLMERRGMSKPSVMRNATLYDVNIRHNHFNKVHESPISFSISILLWVMYDSLPSVNFMYSFLWVWTQVPTLKSWFLYGRYQNTIAKMVVY